jgi:ribonuclease P protein component
LTAPRETSPRRLRPSRSERVRKRSEFDRIQKGGRRVNTNHFVLVLAPGPARDKPARLGITASRRIGGAVQRNRAKRLIRAAFGVTREVWLPGVDLVVIVKKPLGELKLDEVVREWEGALPVIKKRVKEAAAACAEGQREEQ